MTLALVVGPPNNFNPATALIPHVSEVSRGLQSWTFNPLCNGSSLPMLLSNVFLAQFVQLWGKHWKERRKKVDYSMCARMMSLTRVSCNVSRCSMRQSDKLNPLSSKSDRNIRFFKYTEKDHLRETLLSFTQFSQLNL